MNNMDWTLPPELESALHGYYIAHEPSRDFASNLEGRLRHSYEDAQPARLPAKSLSRRRPALAVLLVLLILLLLAGVVYAIGSRVGFIPGVGLVDQTAPIRVLAEPVSDTRQGITLSILKVIADSKHTVLAYRVSGIPPTYNGFPVCGASPVVRLPDGTELAGENRGASGMSSEAGQPITFDIQLTYAPVPPQVKHLTFVLPCILPTPGTGPENWEISISLSTAPANFVTPAAVIGPTQVTSAPQLGATPSRQAGSATSDLTPVPTPKASGLYLDKVIDLPNSYILVGNFVEAGDLPGLMVIMDTSAYTYRPDIVDGNGNPVSFNVRNDVQSDAQWSGGYSWAYEIQKPVQWPLTLTVSNVNVMRQSPGSFQFDTGPNPQPVQEWQLNLPVQLAEYHYVIDSVQLIRQGYVIHFHSGPEVPEGTSYLVDIMGSSLVGNRTASEETRLKDKVLYTENFLYSVPPPTGVLTVQLTLIDTIPAHGPWTLTWSPPTLKP